MRPYSFIQTLAVAALIAVPSIAMAAPDQNTSNNNGCSGGQWINGRCVYNNNNNNNNNGRWNNNNGANNNSNNADWQRRERERLDRERAERERIDHERWVREHSGTPYNPNYNNGGYYNNGAYNNGYNGGYAGGYTYGNGGRTWNYGRGNTLVGTVSSFSPYNLYLNNGQHVDLHNGTVINPTGINLSPGMRVRIIGNQNSDGSFNANEIDVEGNGGYRR